MSAGPILAGLLAQGARSVREGRVDDGIKAYMQALAIRNDLPDAWFNLGWLQRVTRQFDDALVSYACALATGVQRPEEVHLNRSAILSEQMLDTAAAIGELRVAIELKPDFVPGLLNLANLYEDGGQSAAARDAYARVLAIEPANGRAHARLAALDPDRDDVLPRLRVALAAARDPDDRIDILFALGNALDRNGAYDDAFTTIVEANDADARSRGRGYDPGAQERLVAALIAGVDDAVRVAGDWQGPVPVFICGMFRSGSTLCEQMLGRHPLVRSAGELDLVPTLIERLGNRYPSDMSGARSLCDEFRRDYLAAMTRIGGDARFVTDKRCDNFLHLDLIKTLIPAAKVIHTRRHPLDNVVSLLFLRFGAEVPYASRVTDAAHYHTQYARLMAHRCALYGDDIHDFDYDAAVRDPRTEMASALTYLGLSFDEACLDPQANGRVVRTASAWHVRQPLHQRSSGRWRHYRQQLHEAGLILDHAGLTVSGTGRDEPAIGNGEQAS